MRMINSLMLSVTIIGGSGGSVATIAEQNSEVVNPYVIDANKIIDPFVFDVNKVMNRADIVVVGSLSPRFPPYRILTKEFYNISVANVIDGSISSNNLLFVETHVDSSDGAEPRIEESMPYMLFLEKIDLSSEGLPDEYAAYKLVGNWQGIIALKEGARENRSIREMFDMHGIRVDKASGVFIEAIAASYTVAGQESGKEGDIPEGLTSRAKELYNVLKIKNKRRSEKGAPIRGSGQTQNTLP